MNDDGDIQLIDDLDMFAMDAREDGRNDDHGLRQIELGRLNDDKEEFQTCEVLEDSQRIELMADARGMQKQLIEASEQKKKVPAVQIRSSLLNKQGQYTIQYPDSKQFRPLRTSKERAEAKRKRKERK